MKHHRATIIIIGKGLSAGRLPAVLGRFPDAHIWSFAGLHHPRLSLQFEIHFGNRLRDLQPGVPAIVSPWSTPHEAPPDVATYPFPLDEAARLGEAYFESSIDYLLAYAALLNTQELPASQAEALFVQRGGMPVFVERVVLVGVDQCIGSHFRYRPGACFWLGVLRGQGVLVDVSPESALLKRRVGPNSMQLDPAAPHLYGQPGSLTRPFMETHASHLQTNEIFA